MTMIEYLTSSASLEKLCEIEPDKPIRYGILKTAGGVGLGGVTAAAGYGGWQLRGMVTNANSNLEFWAGIGIESIIGIIGLASAGGSLYMLTDGVTSLAKPLGVYFHDDSTYYRNGGYTNKPSFSDKRFGKRVNPIESVDELTLVNDGYVLVNGLVVINTDLSSEKKTRQVPMVISTGKSTITAYRTEHYTEYYVILDGELDGDPLRVFTVTENEGWARKLEGKELGSVLQVRGSLNQKQEIDLIEMRAAFTK